MRRLDETPLDPEIVAALAAIDATLAGEAVDPEHAELAELAAGAGHRSSAGADPADYSAATCVLGS